MYILYKIVVRAIRIMDNLVVEHLTKFRGPGLESQSFFLFTFGAVDQLHELTGENVC